MRHQRLMGLVVLIAAASGAHAAPGGNGDIAQIGFRLLHRCELHNDGAVDCVSESPYLGGPLGNDPAYRPVRMIARGATQLSVGGFASCAIVAGALDCWKDVPATGKTPAAPPERLIATGVTDVSVGDDHACAVTHGAALCWGRDFEGQVGHNDGIFGDGTKQIKPWPVIAKGVSRVAAGGDRSCAIADGALWCWGSTGLASDPHFKDYAGDHPPVRVFARDVTQVAAGSHHVCAIVSGALWCWGDNSHGQVGLGYSIEHAEHSPTTPSYDPRKRGTFADRDQTCFWEAWHDLVCRVEHPVEVIAYGVTTVFASGDETCALASGALMCWGANAQGQLGIAPARDVLKPAVAVALGATFVSLDRTRICAVMTDGALRCTLPCTKNGDALKCPQDPAFVAGDPTDTSGIEARVGVWHGSIGGSKVMVCLERPDTLNESMYYYLRHRFSIQLHANDNSGATWNEAPPNERAPDWSKPAAIWTLHAPVGDVMDGTWSAAEGSRKAPIRLTRVAEAGKSLGSGCAAVDDSPARLAFNAPRVAAQELSATQSSDGFRTTSALGGNVSMTELPASMPHAERFNATMRAWLADKIAGYYECASSSFDGIPDYSETYEIDLLAPPWLVARHNWSGFCGGAHPSSSTDYTTWNLATGETINPWDFLKDSHWDYVNKANHCDNVDDCVRRPPTRLGAIIAARFRHDTDETDCADAIDENLNFLQLHPEKTGLVFSTTFPHVIQACDEDIELPWKTLKPFLTTQGKAAMRSLSRGQSKNGAAADDATSEGQRP